MALLVGEASQLNTLARVTVAGGAPRPVLEGVPYAGADWAPNGRELAVIRNVDGRNRLEAPIGTILLESEGGLSSPRFSPSGDRIALFRAARNPPCRWWKLPAARAGCSRRAGRAWRGVPCWTTGGKEIWFTASRGSEPEALYSVDLSGKERLGRAHAG